MIPPADAPRELTPGVLAVADLNEVQTRISLELKSATAVDFFSFFFFKETSPVTVWISEN